MRFPVLYLSPFATLGGAERALLELLSALRDEHPALVVLGEAGELEHALAERGAEVHVVPFPMAPLAGLLRPAHVRALARAAARIAELARERGVRVAHCGDLVAALLLLPSRRRGVRVVCQVNYVGGWARRLLWALLARGGVDALVAVSGTVRRQLAPVVRGGCLHAIRPGIRPEDFRHGDGARFRRTLGVDAGTPLVGLLARYDTWKGHGVFLRAAATVAAARPDVRFVIAGGALNASALPHVERCRARCLALRDALGLVDRVAIVGHQRDVAGVLAALDVLVCPSLDEPFGMVVLEALAAGVPVVASDSGGPAEIVEDGRSGLLFPTGDAGALAARIVRVLDDDALRRRLRESGPARVSAAFRRERYGRQVGDLYRALA